MADLVIKGIDQTTGRIRRVTATDEAVKTDLSNIVSDQAGAANGLATLNGSSLVVQNPANAVTTVTPNAIVQRTAGSAILVNASPSSGSDATSKSYVDSQVFTGREDVLVANQLVPGASGGVSQALLCAIQTNIAVGDTFTITNGATTETFTGVAAAPVAFQFVVGGSASATTTNLATAISTDSTLWDAVVTTGLDNFFSSAIDPSFVIYRTLVATATDRVYGTIAGGQSRIQVVSFAGLPAYIKTGSVQLNLPSVDGGFQLFGFTRLVAALSPGEHHKTAETLNTYSWDSDDQLWRITSAPLAVANGAASLNGSTLVVQNPASASTTPGSGVIPIADVNGRLADAFTPFAGMRWKKFTVGFAALSAAALTNDIEVYSLAAAEVIHGVKIKHSTAFSGGAIASYTTSVGISGNLTKYASAFDVFQATGNTTFQLSNSFGSENHGAATSIRIAAVATGANLDQATQGSVDVWILVSGAV